MKIALLMLAAFTAGCAPALTYQETAPMIAPAGSVVRVQAGDSIFEGELRGARAEELAIRTSDGRTLELAGYDSLWVRRAAMPAGAGMFVGALLGGALNQLISNATRGRPAESVGVTLAIGGLVGILAASRSGAGWERVEVSHPRPRLRQAPTIRERPPPETIPDVRLERVPLDSRIRISGRFGTVEGRFAGIWNDSVRLTDHYAGFAADSVRAMWTWRETHGGALGGFIGLLVGAAGGLVLGYWAYGDGYGTGDRAALVWIGSMVAGAVIGTKLGSLTEGWRQVIP